MRIAAKPRFGFGNADLRQQFQDPRLGFRAAQAVMQSQDFADLRLNGLQRIERRHRLLEDNRDVVAANAANLVLAEIQQLAGR